METEINAYVRMLGQRSRIETKAHDPARLQAILSEFAIMISLVDQGYAHIFERSP